MPDQSGSDERGADEVTTPSVPGEPGADPSPGLSNVTPVVFGSGLRLDPEPAELADLEDADDAVDISRVAADDAFLDLLGAAVRGDRGMHDDLDDLGDLGAEIPDLPPDFRDDELAALLSSWRDEVDSAPIGEIVDSQLAVATVFAAKARRRRRPRLLVPFAAAAAVLAIAFTGAGLAARDAQPGDTLWSLTKVLYADHARSVEAAASVRQDLDIAQTALAEGKVAEAKSKLEDAQKGLPVIASEDGQAELAATHADLLSQLPGVPANGVQVPPSATPSTASPTPTQQLNPPPSTSSNSQQQPAPTSQQQPSTPPTTTDPVTPPSTTEPPPTTTTQTQPQTESPRMNEPTSGTGNGVAPAEGGNSQGQSFSAPGANGTTSTTP
ncbi:hypothetical protein V5P93_006743 [Actinokineospora auranticolor]|uniref:Anti-sigma-D factor RsdA-like protein n=1 Tax=Actinokineospora auranticolor TaxID=155976 RepID=A0A2S6GWN1_9PSEU|nr:hypothetical protein [Actinokineospora auranticolor]PPK69613.1 hypothetical protein CLV40_103223 [Actinokineospora auranticolor]